MAKIGENKSGRGSIIQSLQLYLFMQEVVITIKFFGRDFDN
jgi:predicted ATP-dependent endonuclease of OLD family